MRTFVIAAILVAAANAFADAPPAPPPPAQPSPDAIKSVWDYFEKGKGQGPILGDSKLCVEISKSGDNKGECTQEMPASGVKAGTKVYLWQSYLVPQNDEIGDVTVQLKLGDQIRETKDVGILKGTFWRQRTWSVLNLGKAGTWTITVMRGAKVLKSYTIVVQ